MPKKKLKVLKKNRNEIAVEKARKEHKEKQYGKKLVAAGQKMGYVRNMINGRYYFARCNIIAEQLNSEKIEEKLDGRTKTKEYMIAEYGVMKMQAIECFRNAHFAKKELRKEHNLTEEEIESFLDDYYNGKIIREEYEERKPKSKAEFVAEN